MGSQFMNALGMLNTHIHRNATGRRTVWKTIFISVTAGFLVVSLGGASIVGPIFPPAPIRSFVPDFTATQQLQQLRRLGLLSRLEQSDIERLLIELDTHAQPLGRILAKPEWQKRLGLTAQTFKSTWYAANPFDLLPIDLQIAIRRAKQPFRSTTDIRMWCKAQKAPSRWISALDKALIETTPTNLWRASRGKKSYARNGQFLQPILVEKSAGMFDVIDGGHIATDPRVIPTNTKLWLLVQIKGEDHLIRVKATDIGGAIKGKHVDLPVTLKSKATSKDHSFYFPAEHIRNRSVVLFLPEKKS
jgi:hypothetical protein